MQKLEFKKLDITDKALLESHIHKYEPYSDFSFLSLFTYNTKGKVEYAFCNENLIIKFEDYLDNECFYSLLGSNKVEETVHLLLRDAKQNGLKGSLNLVPQSVLNAASLPSESFRVEEDPNNFDYIVSSLDIANLDHAKFPAKRKMVDEFRLKYPSLQVKPIDLANKNNQKAILKLFNQWRKAGKISKKDAETERTAIKRLLEYSHHFPDLYSLGIYKNKKLVAFNTYEVATHGHGISSFQKANRKYQGIYAFLTHEMAKSMADMGCEYINFEQDLGLEGLRSSKKSWHPVNYLKKYSISYHETADLDKHE